MRANPAIRNLIRSNNIDGIYQSIQTGSKEGMVTMDASILVLVRGGKVTYEDAIPHVRDEVTKKQLEQFKGEAGARNAGNSHAAAPPPPPMSRASRGG